MNHIELKVNGIRIARDVKDNVRLIDFLREELKLTGTQRGLLGGRVRSLHPVIMDGKSVCSACCWPPSAAGPGGHYRRSAASRSGR
ncbi:Xanthine dehydrogenase iron-sulfur subunit [Klebsiella michiganensis]|uniref:Xanthine dehydrogenase iron-sulfur subunit n=1 Tax=Klebsiella michiganensis TaxID=1134687 RepID=A0A7H4PKN0_9ENTR|nr:Xanthine dehydrogenase iron-sulfur subunit [Klebsiella michiganensis]